MHKSLPNEVRAQLGQVQERLERCTAKGCKQAGAILAQGKRPKKFAPILGEQRKKLKRFGNACELRRWITGTVLIQQSKGLQ
jgi:hypothetical protein